MPTLLIHISDMHLTADAESFVSRAGKIVDAALSPIVSIDNIHLVVSGDIANWGLDEEFEVGVKMLDELKKAIIKRTGKSPTVLITAGNHDCNFTGDQSARDLLVQSARRNPAALTDGVAKVISGVLRRFYDLQRELNPDVVQVDAWRSVVETSGANPLRYVLLNSSVMSIKKEDPGKLSLPIPPHEEAVSGRRTIYVMHHPFNWLQPENARELAQHSAASADLFLMGHEHVAWAQNVHEIYDETSTIYLKGHVLRDTEDSENSAFQTILIDNTEGFRPVSYKWNGVRYEPWPDRSQEEYIKWPEDNGSRKLSFSKEGYRALSSAGANFTHRKKETISLQDIFVWPTLRPSDAEAVNSAGVIGEEDFSGEKILHAYTELPGIVVIRGAEQSGKTALAKMLAMHLPRKGVQPVLLNAANVSSWREKSLNGRIDASIDELYGRAWRTEYRQLPPNSKALIIDDFDLAQVTAGYFDGLRALQQHFGKIILMLDSHPGLEVALTEFLRDECFINAHVYDVLSTSYGERIQLIEKWLKIGAQDPHSEELKLMAAKLSKVVDETLGRNLIPAAPVFILIILQRAELAQDLDTVVKSGSQGFLYEHLIVQALSTKVKVFSVNTSLAYLTALASHLKNKGVDHLDQSEFEEFHVEHCRRYALKAPVNQVQTQMVSADTLDDANGYVRFKYPFHSYYFTARSLSQSTWLLQEPEIDGLVRGIHTERNANILLFLAHIGRNPQIAQKIIDKATSMFVDFEQADMFQAISAFEKFGSSQVRAILFEGDRAGQLAEHQHDLLSADASGKELTAMAESRLRERLDDALAMNAGFKTLQVLGQILRNHAGEIERHEKGRIAEACTSLGLRMLGFLLFLSENHGGEMIAFRAAQLRVEKPEITEAELAEELTDYVPKFVSSISVGTLIKIANAIGAEDLTLTLDDTLSKNSTRKLLRIITHLEHFSEFPRKDILDFEEDYLSRGGFLPNHVLRRFIVRRFYLFPVREELKRAVLEKFKIRALPFKFLEQKRIGNS